MLEQRALATLGTIGAVASSASPAAERLEESMYALRSVLPYVAVHVGHRSGGRMQTILHDGYPDRTRERLESRQWLDEADGVLADAGAVRRASALRQCDLADPGANETVADFLWPAGFREGITCLLRSPRGRLTGVINLSVDGTTASPEPVRDMVEAAGGVVCNLIDEYLLGLQDQATFIIDATGRLQRHAGPDRLDRPEVRVAIEAEMATIDCTVPTTVRLTVGDDELLLAVTPLRHLGSRPTRAVLTLTPAPPLPLTEREIHVVRLLAQGASNPEIAARLGIGRRTVATHVEHILCRLDVANRTEVAVWACRQGIVTSPHPATGIDR
ncbi:MAG: LuxR C-terminal-related transcriptional regulator [Actinomycetota bacterium]